LKLAPRLAPENSASDQEKRLKAVEDKLDQLLKELHRSNSGQSRDDGAPKP
jgi:hypothetical protein